MDLSNYIGPLHLQNLEEIVSRLNYLLKNKTILVSKWYKSDGTKPSIIPADNIVLIRNTPVENEMASLFIETKYNKFLIDTIGSEQFVRNNGSPWINISGEYTVVIFHKSAKGLQYIQMDVHH